MNKKIISSILIILFGLLLIIGSISSTKQAQEKYIAEKFDSYEPLESTNIWLVTDTHYIAPQLTDGGAYYQKMVNSGDGKYMYSCEEITDTFISEVIEAHPDALIISGDLTFNGARESHIAFAKKLAPIKEAGIPLIVIQGNHDFTVNRAARFSGDSYELVPSIDATEFIDIYGDYGYNDAIAKDETSLSYVASLTPNLRILVVDVNTVAGMPGILTGSTLEFIDAQLKQALEDHAYVIGVTHQTLLTHSELISQGMIFINNDKLLKLYENYNVLVNLSGHMHIQHIKESENGFVEIATGSLMTSPNYHAEINLQGKSLIYKAVGSLPADSVTAAAAKDFLWNNSFRQAYAQLNNATSSDEMASYFADFNYSYISGRSDNFQWNPELSQLWDQTDSFVPVYFDVVANEIAETKSNDFTYCKLSW